MPHASEAKAAQQVREFRLKAFSAQLNWLIEHGIAPETRPLGERAGQWSIRDLAIELCAVYKRLHRRKKTKDDEMDDTRNMERNLLNWRTNHSACRQEYWRPLELVFFGAEPTGFLAELQEAFREALKNAWEWRKTQILEERFANQIHDEIMLKKVYEFDQKAYDDISYELFRDWWRAHHTGFLYSKGDKGMVSAVTGFFPVPQQWMDDFLERKKGEKELFGPMIKSARDQRPRKLWYFSGLAANEKAVTSKSLRSQFPNIIGFSILRWMRENYPDLKNQPLVIVSEGATPLGTRLLSSHLGFPLASPADGNDGPRFKRTVTMSLVKKMILEGPLFSKCQALQHAVRTEFPYL